MKKYYFSTLFLNVFLVSNISCQFDPFIKNSFIKGVKRIINIGNQIENSNQNGVLKLYNKFLGSIEDEGFEKFMEKNQKTIDNFLQIIMKNPEYKKLLSSAQKATEQMNAAWDLFRRKTAYLVQETLIKKGSNISFPSHERSYLKSTKKQKDEFHKEFIIQNKDLDPNNPTNEVDLMLGVIALFVQMQTQRNNIKKMCPLSVKMN